MGSISPKGNIINDKIINAAAIYNLVVTIKWDLLHTYISRYKNITKYIIENLFR